MPFDPENFTIEDQKQLLRDFLSHKYAMETIEGDMVHALAYAARLLEDGKLEEAEIYCFYLTLGRIMKPSEFQDFVWTLDREEIDSFSGMGRNKMLRCIEEKPTLMTKKQKAVEIGILSNKISDAAIKGEPQEVLERLIRESMALIDTPTVD